MPTCLGAYIQERAFALGPEFGQQGSGDIHRTVKVCLHDMLKLFGPEIVPLLVSNGIISRRAWPGS